MLKLLLAIGGGTTLAILAIVTTLVVGQDGSSPFPLTEFFDRHLRPDMAG